MTDVRTSTAHEATNVAGKSSHKGLSAGSLGLTASVAIGISTIAPAYTLTASLGPTVGAVGTQMPAIFVIGFVPMLLVALGYRELNADSPDSGTSFTWATKAFGPFVGFLGGWGLVAATIIVLSNLAAIAVDFFYLALAQATGRDSLADLTDILWVNILTCTLFIAAAVYVCYRGIQTTRTVQYVLVAFQLIVLTWFIVAAFVQAGSGEAATDLSFSWSWFNPLEIDSMSAFAAGVSLSIFVFWGWDTCLTLNEETAGSDKTPGRAATTTIAVILAIYLLIVVAVLVFAGVGDQGVGLNNPDIQENVFVALASPVMGPFAILMSLAVLSSSASSLQSTFVSPTRTLLAMGHYRALPAAFAKTDPRFRSPVFGTLVAGMAAAAFYALMRVISDNVLNDTILSLGLMICFYYGLTAFACVWYFRKSALTSARHFLLRFLAPLLGGVGLAAVFLQTTVDSFDPAFGSGSAVGGVGMVFVIGIGILVLGVALMLLMFVLQPGFFKGETLTADTPILVADD